MDYRVNIPDSWYQTNPTDCDCGRCWICKENEREQLRIELEEKQYTRRMKKEKKVGVK